MPKIKSLHRLVLLTTSARALAFSVCFRKAWPSPLLAAAPSINPGRSATRTWEKKRLPVTLNLTVFFSIEFPTVKKANTMSRSDTPVNIWPVVVESVEKKEKVQNFVCTAMWISLSCYLAFRFSSPLDWHNKMQHWNVGRLPLFLPENDPCIPPFRCLDALS